MKAREMAEGKWRSVLSDLGVPAGHLDGKHHSCPKNGEGEDRFRFADRNGSGNFFCACSEGDKGGMALVMCCTGWDYATAAREVEKLAGSAVTDPVRAKSDPRKALNLVRDRVKDCGPAVARYLSARGLEVAPGLKEARLTYWQDGASRGVFDCMVGRIVSPDGKPQSYHLTYLDGPAKAKVDPARKVMTPVETITGGAIRLYPAAEQMGVAEGIETAIAAHQLSGLPVWAAVTAHGVSTFIPPAECKQLTVFADNDASYTGHAAAYALAKRLVLASIKCEVKVSPAGDWNDYLLAQREIAA